MLPPEHNAATHTTISLAKALKIKSRLTGKISELSSTISLYNSFLVENKESMIDVRKLMERRENLVNALVELKTAMYKANWNIANSLELLREKRSDCTFLKSIEVFEGTQPVSYSEAKNTYQAQYKKSELNEMISKLEIEIDDLQDKVDAYNANPESVVISRTALSLLRE